MVQSSDLPTQVPLPAWQAGVQVACLDVGVGSALGLTCNGSSLNDGVGATAGVVVNPPIEGACCATVTVRQDQASAASGV